MKEIRLQCENKIKEATDNAINKAKKAKLRLAGYGVAAVAVGCVCATPVGLGCALVLQASMAVVGGAALITGASTSAVSLVGCWLIRRWRR